MYGEVKLVGITRKENMLAQCKAKYLVNKYYRKNIFKTNYENLLGNFARAMDFYPTNLKIVKVWERPFSVVLNVEDRQNQNNAYFIKIYKIKDFEKQQKIIEEEFTLSRFWFHKLQQDPQFSVVEPVWLDNQNLVLATRKSPGVNLLKLVNKLKGTPPKTNVNFVLNGLLRTGGWLKKFQSFPLSEPVPFVKKNAERSLQYLVDYLQIRLVRMVKNSQLDFEQRDREQVLRFLYRQWEQMDNNIPQFVFTHTDFSLSNVLVAKNRITVLDFGKCEINFPFKDLARLYHQLYLLNFKPYFQGKIIKKMQQSFLEGYGMPHAEEHPLFKIFFLIHQLTHLGKLSRYWEHPFGENIYNRFLVKRVLTQIKETIKQCG